MCLPRGLGGHWPDWNKVSFAMISLMMATCIVLGQYMFAKVSGLLFQVPFRKINLPSWSISWSSMFKGKVLDNRMETPLDFELGLVAWKATGNRLFEKHGTDPDLKCVS